MEKVVTDRSNSKESGGISKLFEYSSRVFKNLSLFKTPEYLRIFKNLKEIPTALRNIHRSNETERKSPRIKKRNRKWKNVIESSALKSEHRHNGMAVKS